MKRLLGFWSALPKPVIDVLMVAIAALDALLTITSVDPLTVAVCVLACAALLLRRRWPLVAFVLTLPGALLTNILAAPVIALFSLAVRTRRRALLVVCGALLAAAEALGWPIADRITADQSWTVVMFVYQAATAAAPILLGQLVQATGDLQDRIREMEATKRSERELYAQTILDRERNQLAREMHDVVSHQVSLIAVQAAALQVTASDPAAREAASSIRALSSKTLDELRSLVILLRVAGTRSPGLAPQPTLADLPALISASGLPVEVTGIPPEGLSPGAQRAVYRTVQEALTNARKHAPGATVIVTFWRDERTCGVTVTNGTATHAPLDLPGARVGLTGLRERAEVLGGSLEAGPTADGFRVHLSVPVLSS